MKNGSLAVVGAGHKVTAQITPEALDAIRRADRVFYAVDEVTSTWLQRFHAGAESLRNCYAVGKPRRDTYEEMAERIVCAVRQDLNVCAVFYGHPGVLGCAAHEAVRRARKEGFNANMFPAVSAEDCLWADIEVDPSGGAQSFEASDFLIFRRRLDTSRPLILWQAGMIGIESYYSQTEAWNRDGIRVLAEVLQSFYSPRHAVIVYESASFPGFPPAIQRVPLARLPAADITVRSTLYVPPLRSPVPPGLRTRRMKRTNRKARAGSLAVVGLGYRVSAQVTSEALNHIRRSEKLFFLVYDPVIEGWLKRIKPDAISLSERMVNGRSWPDLIDEVVSTVCGGYQVCMAFSGHPAVCLTPSYEAVKRVRRRGFEARWLPGISAMDCLYADLGIDPANQGSQLFEASALINLKPALDTQIPLIILQAGAIGTRLSKLKQFLQSHYSLNHKIVLYEAAVVPICDSIIQGLSLSSLGKRHLKFSSTLYIPRSGSPLPDYRMISRLGIELD